MQHELSAHIALSLNPNPNPDPSANPNPNLVPPATLSALLRTLADNESRIRAGSGAKLAGISMTKRLQGPSTDTRGALRFCSACLRSSFFTAAEALQCSCNVYKGGV
eukprot:TRINITY_DN2499_c0_g1_i1.p1 TRINITY_DN2499_c0_g1~~TRINITY_DN2499_c0_g1_i1.p1  ORF type:complete len:107 (+),score=9.44 TRINITY_DN2499_c0_g1_i1:154-474(+)